MGVIMRNKWRRAMVSLALGFWLLILAGPARGADRPPVETPVWTGSGSCAAIACHGGRREPIGLKGSEYSFSEAYDPHIRAYSVLYDDRSKLIEKNYRRLASLELSRPEEDNACLRCHVHQGYESKTPWSRTSEFTEADGAGCEGCHGPAGKWLVPHSEYGWKGLSDQQKFEVFGMRPTKDLLARGQSCAECHVGIGLSDVNHDLIAAGHPRLNFEYGSQLQKLPKHWQINDDKARHRDYEAKVWALGQILTAKASLDLLESRASRSIPDDSTSPWPEFAEYSCFSCHHELVKAGWASANVSLASKPGTLPWGTWSLPMGKVLASLQPGLDADEPGSSLGSLRLLMTQPIPEPILVAQRAREASEELGRVADSVNSGLIAPSEIRLMLNNALKVEATLQPLDWDRAARQYLAIVALDKALADSDPGAPGRPDQVALGRLYKDLNLPLKVERRGGVFDSPYRFDFEQIRGDLRSLQSAQLNP